MVQMGCHRELPAVSLANPFRSEEARRPHGGEREHARRKACVCVTWCRRHGARSSRGRPSARVGEMEPISLAPVRYGRERGPDRRHWRVYVGTSPRAGPVMAEERTLAGNMFAAASHGRRVKQTCVWETPEETSKIQRLKDKYTPLVCTFLRPSCVQKTRLTKREFPQYRRISAMCGWWCWACCMRDVYVCRTTWEDSSHNNTTAVPSIPWQVELGSFLAEVRPLLPRPVCTDASGWRSWAAAAS